MSFSSTPRCETSVCNASRILNRFFVPQEVSSFSRLQEKTEWSQVPVFYFSNLPLLLLFLHVCMQDTSAMHCSMSYVGAHKHTRKMNTQRK